MTMLQALAKESQARLCETTPPDLIHLVRASTRQLTQCGSVGNTRQAAVPSWYVRMTQCLRLGRCYMFYGLACSMLVLLK